MTEVSTCQCCGSPIPRDKVLVDLSSNVLSFGGSNIKLTNGQADFAFALSENLHNTVPYAVLSTKIFGTAQVPKTVRQSMSEYAHRLNRYLGPMGLKVICIRNEGYKMVQTGASI